VAILLGNGAGGFSEAANSPLSTGSDNPGAVSVGDFNEDGKRDLALPGTFGVLSILLGDGTGGFAAGVNTTTNGSTLSFLVADFNEDTHLDVLMGNRMVPGTGTGSFGAPTTVAIPADSGAGFAIDVNNDSHLDVVVASISGLTIVLGNGTVHCSRASHMRPALRFLVLDLLLPSLEISMRMEKSISLRFSVGVSVFLTATARARSTMR
jgi:hypothetical protein